MVVSARSKHSSLDKKGGKGMFIAIVTPGTMSEKCVFGSRQKVLPFAGLRIEGDGNGITIMVPCLGYILLENQKCLVENLDVATYPVVRTWRAVRVLEEYESVDQHTVCVCWSIASSSGNKKPPASPSVKEITNSMRMLKKTGMSADHRELTKELWAGRIGRIPSEQEILAVEERSTPGLIRFLQRIVAALRTILGKK